MRATYLLHALLSLPLLAAVAAAQPTGEEPGPDQPGGGRRRSISSHLLELSGRSGAYVKEGVTALSEGLLERARRELQGRDYAGAAQTLRPLAATDPGARALLAEALQGEGRRRYLAAQDARRQGRADLAAAELAEAKRLWVEARDTLRAGGRSEALARARELEAAGNDRAAIDLYRGLVQSGSPRDDEAELRLGDLYQRLAAGSAGQQRHALRDKARHHLRSVLASGASHDARQRARDALHDMAASVPTLGQYDLGQELQARTGGEDQGRRLCGITSFAAVVQGEGIVRRWGPEHTDRAAFGAPGTPGALLVPGGLVKERVPGVARSFGLDARSTGQGTLRQVRDAIDGGYPVMAGGEGWWRPSAVAGADGRFTSIGVEAYHRSYGDGHWMVLYGYRAPSEQTPSERLRSGGQALYYFMDPDRARRFEVPARGVNEFLLPDGQKHLVSFGS
ncbi:MAG: hypothetical protein AB7N76_28055 [Planctomycetota bacterium]